MIEIHPTERRAHPRFEFPPEDEQRVAVGPLSFRLTQGVVVNISRGGVKVRLDQTVFGKGQGTEWCMLRFLDAGDELRPHSLIGIVRNVGEDETEQPFATIEFGQPLELLDLPRAKILTVFSTGEASLDISTGRDSASR